MSVAKETKRGDAFSAVFGEKRGSLRPHLRMTATSFEGETYLGQRLQSRTAIDLYPHASIPSGSLGIVVASDSEQVHVRMDDHYSSLEDWQNCIVVSPDEWCISHGESEQMDRLEMLEAQMVAWFEDVS